MIGKQVKEEEVDLIHYKISGSDQSDVNVTLSHREGEDTTLNKRMEEREQCKQKNLQVENE